MPESMPMPKRSRTPAGSSTGAPRNERDIVVSAVGYARSEAPTRRRP